MSRPLLISAILLSISLSSLMADETIARVGESEIKKSDILPFLVGISEVDRDVLTKNPAALSQAVRRLILQKILFKEATSAGWDKSPEMAQQIERVRQSAIAESYLDSISKVPAGYPTDADVKAVYEARKAQMLIPKQYRLAQIFLALPAGSDKKSEATIKARADEIAKAAKTGDFAAIAREKSEERVSAARGGELGFLAEANVQPEIASKLSSLGKGAVSDSIRLKDGFYVVKVLEIKEPATATLEEVRPQIEQALRNERLRQNRETYLGKLQQQNPIALDELTLGKLLLP